MDASRASLPPLLAERYAVQSHVGSGGMADVFLAQDLKLQRTVAIKVLRPDFAGVVGPRRFLREIKIASTLSHPHIIPVHDSGEADGLLWYVMPYVEGESLHARLKREQQLPLGLAVRLAREIADALEYAHARRIVHRDIKPENVLLQGAHAVVTDFGIARAFTEGADAARLTSTGVVVGTPQYMSPEQGAGEREVDARTDVYSLGCVLYEMLVGEPPFTGATVRAVVARHVSQPPSSMRIVRPEVPEALERVVMKALAKTPADRWATAGEMGAALGQLGIDASTDESLAQTAPRRAQTRRRAAAFAIAAGVLTLGGIAMWSATVGNDEPGNAAISSFRIAVYPARVQGGVELAYLGEGLMDLLSGAFDGLGELRRVDPHALMGRLREDGVTLPIDPTDAERLAQDFGAARYVLVSALQVGSELRISASLYDVARGADPLASTDVQGEPARLPELVQSIALQLLRDVPLGSGGRLADLSIPDVGTDVLRAYLEGEAFLRAGQFQSAQPRLELAVDTDSTFALGWYRLSMAEGAGSVNAGRHGDTGLSSLAHALEHADRLSPRDRLLVEAFHANRFGDADRAETLAQTAIERYPDNVEAWFALGETLTIYGWRWGRPLADALEPLGRALSMDPGYAPAALRYAYVAEAEHRYDEVPRYLAAHPIWPGAIEGHRLILALHEGDSRTADSLLAIVERLRDRFLSDRAESIAEADSLQLARRLLASVVGATDRSPSLRASARFDRMLFSLAAGRWEEARSELAAPEMGPLARQTPILHALSALPFFERPREELVGLSESLVRLELPPLGEASEVSAEISAELSGQSPRSLQPWLREYALGVLAARLGDEEQALQQATALESAQEPPDPEGLRSDLALEIRALSLATAGQPLEALRLLEDAEYRMTRYGQSFNPYFRRPFGRFMRAELLLDLGREEEALAWFASFGWTYPAESVFLAPALLRRGEIHERRGEYQQALHFYRRFLARWRDADPEYQQLVRDVEVRVARLQGSG